MSQLICPICCENNIKKSNITICPYCEYKCCKICMERYIYDIKRTEKSCMNCNRKLTRTILINMFNKRYIDGLYKNHIKEILFEEQKAEIPRTQESLSIIKDIRKIEKIIKELEHEGDIIVNDYENLEYILLKNKISGYKRYLGLLKLRRIRQDDNVETLSKHKYIYPCSNNDCKGFVNKNWYCELCEKTSCKKCFKLVLENHECNIDDIETANLIKKESKPCPGCNISIMKSSGCHQMWCTSCHVHFDWRTLTIIKKNEPIHNPEYFRYMRENNLIIERTFGDDICRNRYHDNIRKIQTLWYQKSIEKDICSIMYNYYRIINHIDDINLRPIRIRLNDNDKWHKNERIKYLLGDIDDRRFKINIAKKFKNREMLLEKQGIIITLYDILMDTFIDLAEKILKINLNDIKIKIKKINEFIEQCMIEDVKICEIYDTSCRLVIEKIS